jgi:hypothetical protein
LKALFKWILSIFNRRAPAGPTIEPEKTPVTTGKKDMGLFNPLLPPEIEALNMVSMALGISPAWLDHLISFESSWNPAAVNKITGAIGLIQFMPATARSMGYIGTTDLLAKNPDKISQLRGPVFQYLKQYLPYTTEQSLYMAVFYPAARSWPVTQAFPDSVQKANPGIKTVQDYINRVTLAKTLQTLKPLAIIAVAVIGIYFLNHHFKGEKENGQTIESRAWSTD